MRKRRPGWVDSEEGISLDEVLSTLLGGGGTTPHPGALTPSTGLGLGRLALTTPKLSSTPAAPATHQRKHARTGSLRTASSGGGVYSGARSAPQPKEPAEVLASLGDIGRTSAVLALAGHAVTECARDWDARVSLCAAAGVTTAFHSPYSARDSADQSMNRYSGGHGHGHGLGQTQWTGLAPGQGLAQGEDKALPPEHGKVQDLSSALAALTEDALENLSQDLDTLDARAFQVIANLEQALNTCRASILARSSTKPALPRPQLQALDLGSVTGNVPFALDALPWVLLTEHFIAELKARLPDAQAGSGVSGASGVTGVMGAQADPLRLLGSSSRAAPPRQGLGTGFGSGLGAGLGAGLGVGLGGQTPAVASLAKRLSVRPAKPRGVSAVVTFLAHLRKVAGEGSRADNDVREGHIDGNGQLSTDEHVRQRPVESAAADVDIEVDGTGAEQGKGDGDGTFYAGDASRGPGLGSRALREDGNFGSSSHPGSVGDEGERHPTKLVWELFPPLFGGQRCA